MKSRVMIIAEAGVNHNGDIGLAKQLVDAAVHAKADLIKFQSYKTKNLTTFSAPKAPYQREKLGEDCSQYSLLEKLELTDGMHVELLEYCNRSGITFFSSAFDIESLHYLNSLGLERIKIPSGEITNLPLLREAAKLRRPIILSTGMAEMEDIRHALKVFEDQGLSRSEVTLLHCSTAYPTLMVDVNLRAMVTIRESFNVSVGYSDHTLGIETAIAAVALGARVVEKHLTLDRNLTGPDHRSSLGPREFSEMVTAIRNIEIAMGDGVKKSTHAEEANRLVVRKSLVALKEIGVGEDFTQENVGCKRPGTGVSPMRWDEVMGKKSNRNYLPDDLIEL